MIKKLLPLLLLILIGCSSPEPLNYGLLVERDGVHYRKDTNEIYSGPVFNIDGKSEGTVKKGKFHGPFKFYHPNGQLKSEGTFKDSKQDGPLKWYYDNGQLESEGFKKDDKQDGPLKYYYENGQLESEGFKKDDKQDGPLKYYYENGQLKSEETYNNGKLDGPYKDYYPNGQLNEEGTYKDGKKDRISKVYSIKGEPIEQVRFVLHFDLPHLINNLAYSKDKKFDIFLEDLNNQYSNNKGDFFTLLLVNAFNQDLKLYRYFKRYGKTNEGITEELKLEANDAINRIIEIIQNRLDQFGVPEQRIIQKQGNDRITVESWVSDDINQIRILLQSTALLEFMIVKNVESTNTIIRQIDSQLKNFNFSSLLIAVGGNDLAISSENLAALKNILNKDSVKQVLDATGSLFLTGNSPETLINDFGEEEEFYLLYHLVDNAELTGSVIEDAQARISQSGVTAGQATVQVEMNNEGSRELARITGANINKRMAIALDKKVLIAPLIRSQIFGGAIVIEGLDSLNEAEQIAILLLAGALPFPVTIIE